MYHAVFQKKIFSLLCRLKINPCDGETEHVFILGPMDCTVGNSFEPPSQAWYRAGGYLLVGNEVYCFFNML